MLIENNKKRSKSSISPFCRLKIWDAIKYNQLFGVIQIWCQTHLPSDLNGLKRTTSLPTSFFTLLNGAKTTCPSCRNGKQTKKWMGKAWSTVKTSCKQGDLIAQALTQREGTQRLNNQACALASDTLTSHSNLLALMLIILFSEISK